MIPVPVLPSVFFLCGSISLLGAIIDMYDIYIYIYIYVLYIYIYYIYQEYIHIYGADICSPILWPYFCLCRSPSLIGRDDAVVKVTPCMFGFGGFCRLLEVSCFEEISCSWNSCRMLC